MLARAAALVIAVSLAGVARASPPPIFYESAVVEVVAFVPLAGLDGLRVEGVLAEVRQRYKTKVAIRRLVVEDPMTTVHRQAAIAIEAASRQAGGGTRMHLTVVANSDSLGAERLRLFAAAIGLDLARYDRDVSDPAIAAEAERNARTVEALDVKLPTLYVNGQRYVGADPAAVVALVDRELAAAGTNKGAAWRNARIAQVAPDLHRLVTLGEAPSRAQVVVTQPLAKASLVGSVRDIPTQGALKLGRGKRQVVLFADIDSAMSRDLLERLPSLAERHRDDVTLWLWPLPRSGDAYGAAAAATLTCAARHGAGWALVREALASPRLDGEEEFADDGEVWTAAREWARAAGVDKAQLAACTSDDAASRAAAAAQIGLAPEVFVGGRRVDQAHAPNLEALILAP